MMGRTRDKNATDTLTGSHINIHIHIHTLPSLKHTHMGVAEASPIWAAVVIFRTVSVALTTVLRLIRDIAPKCGTVARYLGYIDGAGIHVAFHDLRCGWCGG